MGMTEQRREELIAQLKDPEMHFPGNFDTVKRANAMLMCLCQEAADALSASAPSERKPVGKITGRNFGCMPRVEWYDSYPKTGTLLYTAFQPDYKAQRDAERLDFLEREYIKVDSFEMPTGGDDADVGWRLSQHHMGNPRERVVAEYYKDDLRSAIDAAIASVNGWAL